ncbi:hypothetical protein Neosp_014915 [[Neocosmospora] mangrovei]
MDEDADYYRILEIDDSADEATIKQKVKANYKRLARKHHPDKNPGDENATTRFQKRPVRQLERLSNSSGTGSRNMIGNADNKSINVGKRKTIGERNNSRGKNNHDVNEKKNAREMSNVAKTRSANRTNNSAPGSGMKPRKQKGNPIPAMGSRGIPSPLAQCRCLGRFGQTGKRPIGGGFSV